MPEGKDDCVCACDVLVRERVGHPEWASHRFMPIISRFKIQSGSARAIASPGTPVRRRGPSFPRSADGWTDVADFVSLNVGALVIGVGACWSARIVWERGLRAVFRALVPILIPRPEGRAQAQALSVVCGLGVGRW